MSAKEQRKQQVIFLMIVLLVIFVSIGAGLYFGGMRLGNFSENNIGNSAGTRYATLTDAQIICEEQARKVFGKRIRNLAFDTHSTRLDKKAGVFRVFIESDLYVDDSHQGASMRYFISCVTRTDRVAIASFQYAKDGEAISESGKSEFGF